MVTGTQSFAQTITTVAGGGAGDGLPATSAFMSPYGAVSFDGAGNLYIAEDAYDRIRRVDTSGITSTVAGTGTQGFSGDGGPATVAQLNGPQGVFVDGAGNLFIAESANARIRKVSPPITETTAAAGLSGTSVVNAGGGEIRIFAIGLTGDGVGTVSSVALTLSDLSTATGLVTGDFSALKLYRSTDATLDGSDTQIGSQTTVNVGSVTTVSATTPNVPPNGTQTFYRVSAVASSTVGHAFKVGFAANGVNTSVGGKGTAVATSDANKVTIIPAVPVLVEFSGATQATKAPSLDWNDAAGATSYTVEWANNAGFTSSTTTTGLTASTFTFPTRLADGTYHWRVKSVGAGALESSFSATDTFVIIPAFGPWTVPLLALAMIAYMVWYNRRRARTGTAVPPS